MFGDKLVWAWWRRLCTKLFVFSSRQVLGMQPDLQGIVYSDKLRYFYCICIQYAYALLVFVLWDFALKEFVEYGHKCMMQI
jgi:hypothetical protein